MAILVVKAFPALPFVPVAPNNEVPPVFAGPKSDGLAGVFAPKPGVVI